ncbi:MAG: hypothetical protein CMF39_00335 [Legionellaceae bacterium]|nr:hypothetical protein [Legionellaceae bacterium]|tara:strand:+ start:1415 stop:2179 length:765 start_codon:yes stop_codon:yes gene_type:complete
MQGIKMKKYQLIDDKERYIAEIDELIYANSNEKAVLKAALQAYFSGKHFSKGLDVGPGPGLISMPLYECCDELTLLEYLPEYKTVLQEKYPKANIVIDSIETVRFDQRFDLILFAHVIYFFKFDQWPDVFKKMLNLLTSDGELLIVVADVCSIINLFSKRFSASMSANYMSSIDQLKQMLMSYAQVSLSRHPISIVVKSRDQLVELVTHMLGIEDRDAVLSCEDELQELEAQMVERDGQMCLELDNVIFALRHC